MRAYMDILEAANKANAAVSKAAITGLTTPVDGKKGDSVTINGYKISKLPSTADFAYEVEKKGKGEKFYSVDAVLKHIS